MLSCQLLLFACVYMQAGLPSALCCMCVARQCSSCCDALAAQISQVLVSVSLRPQPLSKTAPSVMAPLSLGHCPGVALPVLGMLLVCCMICVYW